MKTKQRQAKKCARLLFLTSFTRLSCIAAVTLAVSLAQARHPALSMLTLREATGISRFLVLLVAEHARVTGLAAAGVGVRVDRKAGAVDTPEDGETGKAKIKRKMYKKNETLIARTNAPTCCHRRGC